MYGIRIVGMILIYRCIAGWHSSGQSRGSRPGWRGCSRPSTVCRWVWRTCQPAPAVTARRTSAPRRIGPPAGYCAGSAPPAEGEWCLAAAWPASCCVSSTTGGGTGWSDCAAASSAGCHLPPTTPVTSHDPAPPADWSDSFLPGTGSPAWTRMGSL